MKGIWEKQDCPGPFHFKPKRMGCLKFKRGGGGWRLRSLSPSPSPSPTGFGTFSVPTLFQTPPVLWIARSMTNFVQEIDRAQTKTHEVFNNCAQRAWRSWLSLGRFVQNCAAGAGPDQVGQSCPDRPVLQCQTEVWKKAAALWILFQATAHGPFGMGVWSTEGS